MKPRRGEGHPLKETQDMVEWRKGFQKMTLEDHIQKLKGLGLDEEDIEEFKEDLKEDSAEQKKKKQD